MRCWRRENASVTNLVLVPGFTQTASSWDAVRAALDPRYDAHAIDVPDAGSFAATAAAIGDAAGRAVYCGYSMGGRLCLRLALDRPDLVAGLVVVSANAGIEDAAVRAERVASDEELARFVEAHGVDAFLERWLAQPLFAGVPADAPGIAERRSLTAPFVAHCLRDLGAGTMASMWDDLPGLSMPVAVVWGERDTKYERIGRLLAHAIPRTITFAVERCGHAVPLERPDAMAQAIDAFVASLDADG